MDSPLVGKPSLLQDPPPAPAVEVTRMTRDEMFRRIRSRERITRGRFAGLLRRAIRAGEVRIVPGAGVMLELTGAGLATLSEALKPTE